MFLKFLQFKLVAYQDESVLTVGTAEDRILLLMYFLIALINGVLTDRSAKWRKEIHLTQCRNCCPFWPFIRVFYLIQPGIWFV